MRRPRVSVVMPVRNAGGVHRGIDSILVQTCRDFEFVIVDDGSDDGTSEALEEYQRLDGRIRLIRLAQRAGIPVALNTGIAVAAADVIARMDADDFAYPVRLEHQLAFLDENPAVGVLGSNFIRHYEDTNEEILISLPEHHDAIQKQLSYTTALCHPAAMIRAECFKKFGGYDVRFRRTQDYELWMRWRRSVRFHNLQEILVRMHSPKVDWEVRRGTTRREILRWQLQIRLASMSRPGYRTADLTGLVRFLGAHVKNYLVS